MMTDRDVIDRVAVVWGVKPYARSTPGRKVLHRVSVQGRKGANWMLLLYPLMGSRRQGQIRAALGIWEETGGPALARRSKNIAKAVVRRVWQSDGTLLPSLDVQDARGNATLSAPIVALAKGLLKIGVRQRDVIWSLGISQQNLNRIAKGETWRWVAAADVRHLLPASLSEATHRGIMAVVASAESTTSEIDNINPITQLTWKESKISKNKLGKLADQIREELAELDERKTVLERMLIASEDLDTLEARRRKTLPNVPQGTRSMRSAVLQVLSEATGPLKPKEIWERVQVLGAATRSKSPVSVTDLACYQLRQTGAPIEKRDEGWAADRVKLGAYLKDRGIPQDSKTP
jgi:hypothetical protein